MTNELQTKLDAILEDKNNNLKPENLKAGVTCLGVEGTLENIDITGITTTPDNVEYGKKFINKSGKLDTGRFTPVTMLYKDVDVDVEMQTLTKTFGTDTSLVFNNLGIFWDTDGLHIIHNISDTTETIEQYDFTTEDTEIKYVDAGCKDYFGTDTILIILTTGKVMYLYLYDISTNELTLKNTIPYGASSYPALNPEYNIVHLNDGQQYATYSSSKMYEISSTFTLSTLYTIKLSWGTTASRVQNIFWINKDMYHVLRNNSKTSDLYNYSEDMTVGATHRLKLDRTGYVHINTSAIVNGYEYYIVGASPDSSIIIRANTALGKGRIFTTSFENSVYTETDTGLNCTASAYTRALFLSNSTFMTLYTGMYIYKLHDNTIEQIANYTGSFGKLINRYYPVISYNNVYNKLLVADATSAINKVIVKGQTFVDPSLVPSGGILAEEEYNRILSISRAVLYGDAPIISYTPIEYIATTSSGGQFIDTGIVVNNSTEIEVDFMDTADNPDWERIVGSNSIDLARNGLSSTFYCRIHGEIACSFDVTMDVRTKLKVGAGNLYINDSLSQTYTNTISNTADDSTLYIGTQIGGNRVFTGRIYGVKIWQSGALIRDFVPAKDIDGNVHLYDKITNKLHKNIGSGSFIAGPELEV